MWKPLVVLAIVANTVLITPSEGTDPDAYCESLGHGKPPRKCRKPNEVYDLCPAPCPPRECDVDEALILCAPPPKPGSSDCRPGCRCADGYLRNRAGICIPEAECEYDCAKNETLDPCLSDCPPRLCGVNIAAVSCLAISENDCEPGCRCSDGFLRNAEGVCVLEDDCPKCTNLNEVYDVCPAPCPPRRCDIDDRIIDCAPPPNPGDPECEPGCRCADGFYRNANGVCVTRDQCTKCTGPNEVYDICPAPCPPRRCDVDERLIRCAAPPEPGDPNCEPGCRCADGFYRNANGVCVTREQCLKCPGPHEYFACGGACDNVCATLSEQNQTYCPIVNIQCNSMCYCEKGYARDDNNICIPIKQCECGKHEIFSECPPYDCRPLECSQVGYPVACPVNVDHCPGKPACICDYGYVKDCGGKCIPIEQCPSCGGDPNAVSGCGVNCGRHCSDRNKKHPVSCIAVCYENACDCRDGYLYDDNIQKCVLPEKCTPVCGKDEVYSDCIQGECRPKNCSEIGFSLPCPRIDPSFCIKGCLCKEGYVRATNGTCIPNEKCPSCGGDPNAVSGCGVNCGRRCSDQNKGPVSCPAICNSNGCDCKKGFVLDDSTGKCILPSQCVSCRGDYNAEPGCDKDCSERCPGPKPSQCRCYKDGCKCKNGFVYDPKVKRCVRPEQCDPPCGNHEVLSNCSNGGCGPWTCADVGFPTGCVKMDQKYCTVGCVCEDGYVRENGVCIPVTNCPECGGDPNAVAGCGINCGRLCSNYDKGPVACPAVCLENACDCKKEYVFDEITKKCVLPEHCTICSGANEIYDPCPPNCPPQTCESIGQKYFCPLIPANKTSKDCHGACRCKPNYLRNKIGECISAKDCLKCTGPNEYFSCGGACDNVCATLSEQNQTNCPIVNIQCNSMCYCEEGYARDYNNICIPIDQCPDKNCGINERWEQCPARLCTPQSCKELGFEITCEDAGNSPCPGPPGCVCDFNYVRDDTGKCIPVKKCTSCGGDPNAESGCGLNCGRLCSNYDKGPVACPRICYPNSCDCKKDFVYDENIKKCVYPKQCTPVCGHHEVYSECTNGGCDARNCSQLGQPVPCIKLDPKYCIKGCVCEEGYLRARNGTCVPEEKCDHCNQPHEHYNPCTRSCPPQTCESIGRKYKCPITAAVCRGACQCDEGYLRNKIGECIRKQDCLKCRGRHEYFSCGGACDNVCATLHKQNQTNCPIVNIKCNPMCYCEKGYARNKNNVCIPIEKCPKPTCRLNERLEQCPPGLCTPQKCTELGFPIACPDLPEYGCPEPPGCVCIDDYVRDARGNCIPNQNCPSCGGDPNAVAGCGNPCGRTCALYKRTDIVCAAVCYINACDCRKGFILDDNTNKCVRPKDCTPVCKKNEVYDPCANGGCGKRNCSQLGQPDICIDVIKCIGGCVCQEGYLRAKNGTCVPQYQCPIPPCGKNERFELCPDSLCEPQTCSQLGFPILCPALSGDSSCPGQPACICDYGFVRNDYGICVPKKQCLSCGGDPNAESGCGINCGRLCSNYNKGPVPCPKICKLNSCDCKKDFVFDTNTKKCVRPKQCTPICGKDEVYSECINGGCQAKNCSQLGKPVPCVKIDPKYCIKGCLCKEGYLRENNGVCVPIDDCDRNCWEPHTIYERCPPSCPPQTCESIGKKYSCPAVIIDDKNCKGACRCKKNYFRNKIGECISKEDCLRCTGSNEYFSCGGACDNVCATLSQQNQTNCPIINVKCNPMCYCAKGYARDDNNICIPIDQCPVPKCGKNERLEDCPEFLCTPQSCSQLGYPISCPAFTGESTGSCPGRPGCVCIDKYVRDDSGKCIPVDQCPSCGGDPNAVSGCGVNCGRLCSNYKKKDVVCPLICNLNGCDCRHGYVYDSNIEKCVRPKHCTPVCGKNEVYDICANGGCQKRNCSQVGEPMLCIDPIKCIGGCVCQEGFLRNKDGDCVPENQCPLQCTKPHEVYDPCSVSCPPQTCDSIGKVYPCPHPPDNEEYCRGACRCEQGYYRNSIGECISERDCLKCTGPNEHFACGGACDNVCATLSHQNQTHCPIINIKCNDKCYCDKGYARDDNGICIPIEQCGVSCNGDPNAIPGCGTHCGRRCSDYDKGVTICPLICYLHGCDCKQNYVYDDNLKICVLPKDCTPVCGKDEVYNTCINGGCQKKKCSDLERPDICVDPIKCRDGCLCKKGFLRADNGTCVPINQCPMKCNRPHEVFNICPSSCPPQTCESLDRVYICPIEWGQEPPCEPSCVCEDGYFRNKIGECLSEADCLKCMGPHEYFTCGGACDNVCAILNEQSQDDCPIINIQCNSMCYCEKGYARNDSNICIPIEECPPSRCGPNERYEESPSMICEPLYCSEVGQPMDCPPVEDPDCEDTPACICKRGLVRNDTGVCVLISECPSTSPPVNSTEARARLDKGSTALAGEFLYQLVSGKPDENAVASGTSLFTPLAQLALFATEANLDELLGLLNLENKDEIKSVFPELTEEFENLQNLTFELATKHFANINNPLSQDFQSQSLKYFHVIGENIDFSENFEAADTINDWVSNETHGKIQDLVTPDMFNKDTRLCLVNAIYFLGNWEHQFNPNDTTIKDFYKSNGETVPLKIMYQKHTFNYAETDQFQALEMFYKGNTFSFLVILPKDKNGLLDTVKTLRDPDVFYKVIQSLKGAEVKVSLPKMLINTKIDIRKLLMEYNVTTMFDPSSNGFQGILANEEPVYVTDAVQKAFISVDETGTEAAAATGIVVGTTSVSNIYSFEATRPFAFYILYESKQSPEKVPLFCGSFVGAQ